MEVSPGGASRARADLRLMLEGIIFRLGTDLQRYRLPERFGRDSTAHEWFQRFAADGALEERCEAPRRV